MNLIGKLFFAVRISQDFDQLSFIPDIKNVGRERDGFSNWLKIFSWKR